MSGTHVCSTRDARASDAKTCVARSVAEGGKRIDVDETGRSDHSAEGVKGKRSE